MSLKQTICLIISLTLLSSCGGSKANKVVYLGSLYKSENYSLKALLDQKKGVNSQYSCNKYTSSLFYSIIEQDAKKDDIVFSSVLKKTKKVLIHLGFDEFNSYFKIKDNNLIFDTKIMDQRLEIFQYNLYLGIEQIQNINSNVKVAIGNSFVPFTNQYVNYQNASSYYSRINFIIDEIAKEKGCDVFDLTKISNYINNSFQISDTAIEELNKEFDKVIYG